MTVRRSDHRERGRQASTGRCGAMALAFAIAAPCMLAFTGIAAASYGPFGDPQTVTIEGYPGSAEEPFITPDGRYLLFNSSEAEPDFSLQFASRVDAQTFEYQGEIQGEG